MAYLDSNPRPQVPSNPYGAASNPRPQGPSPLDFRSLPAPAAPAVPYASPRTTPEPDAARRMVDLLQQMRAATQAGGRGPGMPSIPDPGLPQDLRQVALEFPTLSRGLEDLARSYEAASGAQQEFASEGRERGLPGMAGIAPATSPAFQSALGEYQRSIRDRAAQQPVGPVGPLTRR